jgi:type IV secretory pathway VirB3-like protein
MMTKKVYKAVAAILADPSGITVNSDRKYITVEFAKLFAEDNPRFDRDRFYKAAAFEP